jgi:RHS repeat-associated protein
VSGITTGTYTYDLNGNVKFDAHTGKTTNIYNLLNLPGTVTAAGFNLTYTYDANGQKLRKNNGTINTEYIDGIQYENGVIIFVQTEEGRALKNGVNYLYEYSLTDHLGNTRLSFDQNSATSIKQQDDYYPFGMEISRGSVVSPKNNYLYNKKELQAETGQYDYGARFYDPVVARWTTIDPKAEKFTAFTPYNYAFNDPILVVDLDGQEGIVVVGQPGDHKNKNHFLDNALSRAKKLQKQFDKAGKGEKATILLYKGKDGSASYSDKQIAAYEKQAQKAGISVKVEESKDAIVDYVNNKDGGDSRKEDLISNFTYVGHAAPGNLEIAYQEHGRINDIKEWLGMQRLDIGAFDKDAFTSNSTADLVAACRTALSGWPRSSAMDQMAEKVGGTVSGSNVRVDFWKAGSMTNSELLKTNNGRVITTQGHGGVSKQQVEN